MSATKSAVKRATKTAAPGKEAGFTSDERSAMKARADELKSERQRSGANKPDGEADVIASIAKMAEADRMLAERLHALIKRTAPTLSAKTWYGMPAYARDGDVICFFQAASKFKTRYATLGFSDKAHLDEGTIWPTAYALSTLTADEEKKVTALLTKALR